MKGVVKSETHDFDPIMLNYTEQSVCYPDNKSFLYITTPECKVLHVHNNQIWITINHEWVRDIIDSVDTNLVQHRCKSKQEYMEQISLVNTSLKLSPSMKRNILVVRLGKTTEIHGSVIKPGDTVRVVLYANYYRCGIVWFAAKLQNMYSIDVQETDPEFLQECQLEQTYIKI